MELEVLGGLLMHCCKVVHGSRRFSRKVYELIVSVKKSHHKVRLNAEFRHDIEWWVEFVAVFKC